MNITQLHWDAIISLDTSSKDAAGERYLVVYVLFIYSNKFILYAIYFLL